jgi:hypothetical protein
MELGRFNTTIIRKNVQILEGILPKNVQRCFDLAFLPSFLHTLKIPSKFKNANCAKTGLLCLVPSH